MPSYQNRESVRTGSGSEGWYNASRALFWLSECTARAIDSWSGQFCSIDPEPGCRHHFEFWHESLRLRDAFAIDGGPATAPVFERRRSTGLRKDNSSASHGIRRRIDELGGSTMIDWLQLAVLLAPSLAVQVMIVTPTG